jgi:hypothetical protein
MFAPTPVSAGVVDPNLPVAGISQRELSQQWWQWALSVPTAANPILDTNGSSALVNNNGPVFFVAGNFGVNSVRNFNVPAGKPIFFPLLNNIDVEFAVTPPNNCFDLNPGNSAAALQCALGFISPALDTGTNMHATLDGQDLLTYPSYRQTSTSFFDITLPADNLFGAPAGSYPGISVSDGYWVALEGLSPGKHTLNFGGSIGNNYSLEVTDTLNAVPEPGTVSLVLLGAAALLGHRRFGGRVRHLISGKS